MGNGKGAQGEAGAEKREEKGDVGGRGRPPLNPPPSPHSFHRVRSTYTPFDYAASVLPCVRWLSTYSLKSNLLFDFLAGASVAALVVPQGMSYARLAGLPQEYGLYGAFVPVMVYAALGSSRHLVRVVGY